METKKYIAGQVAGIILPVLHTVLVMATATAVAQVSTDSLSVDSAAYRRQAGARLMVPMALPSPPNISYTIPPQLQAGVAVSFSPTNSGGLVYADWDVTTFAGSTQGYADGTGTGAKFYYPSGMVSDASGNLYISDSRNHRIRKVTPAGTVTTFAGSGVAGSADGTGTAAGFNYPVGLALDGSGNLYVVDRSNHRIRRITPSGAVSTLAGSTQGYADGTGTAAKFDAPSDIALDAMGNVYVTDEQNQRIRKITPSGAVTTLAGSGTQGNADGTGTAAQFNIPQGLAIDGSGNLYVGDQVGSRIRKVPPAGAVTTLTTGVSEPISLELGGSGDLYAGELYSHRIRKITPAGVVTTVAGTGSAGSDNGPPLSASFNFPGGIAFDPQGNMYVADMWNNRIRRMGAGQGYSVSPALPAGLSLDKTTGVISGTPVSATGPASYTVTAYNAGGPGTYTITFSVGGASSSTDQNYIMKTTYLTAVPQPDPTVDEAMRDITYFDGLGRPMQEVQVRAVPAKTADVVVPIAYDAYGRMDRDYLPYATATGVGGAFKSGAVAAQAGYYNAPPAGVVKIDPVAGTGVTPSFAQRVYEPSPLDRVTDQGFPGAAWQPAATRGTTGRTVSTAYATNNGTAFATVATTRMVSRYGYAVNALGEPTLTLDGTYPAGELYVTITRDENWNGETATFAGRLHTTEEYTDKQGRVVLRRAFNLNGTTPELLSTYYVYNDLGQLSAVLPPEINPDRTGSVPPDVMDLIPYVFGYLYDDRGRVIEKVVPGRNPENYVYNPMGWLVYHQDGRQASETITGFSPGQYHTFYKYDGIGRVIMKGVERNRTWTRAQIQYHVDTTGIYWEERSEASGNMHGYTNRSNPWGAVSGDMDVLEVHYYDRYDDIPGLPHNESAGYSKLTHGRLVASKVKVLESEPAAYLWTVYYYDDHGRVVREWKQHYLGGSKHANKFDDILREYTFTGQLKKETRKHHSTSGTAPGVTVTTEHGHDHRERLTHTWKTVNSGTRVLLSKHTYNEVGQLHEKGLHSTDGGTTFGQKVRYSYNPRGWLRYTHSDLFRQLLNYGDTTANPQFNGNISHQVFMRRGNDVPPSWVSDTYSYRYDGVNRLIEGTMGSGKGMERLTYSKNGNIKSLRRTDGTGAPVDRLRYDYGIWGNVLASVHDTLLAATPDFQHPGTTYYKYDNNGNMTGRTNGGSTGDNIDTVIYNHLNLPRQVTAVAGNVTYVYDATGRKLRSINAANGQTRDYIDGIEYVGGTMELIHTEDGRITRSGGTYTHHYFLRDHLGNNRAGFIEGTDVTTPDFVADYYPFGLQYLQSIARSGSPKNNYLYNGKELQDGLKQYDYGARFYDPVIGRWGSVDPLAENHTDITPYNYVLNNPLIYTDEFGLDTTRVIKLDEVVVTARSPKSDATFNVLRPGVPFNWNGIDYREAQRLAGQGTRDALLFSGEQFAWSLIPVTRIVKLAKPVVSLVWKGGKALLPEVASLGTQKMLKIMSKSHAWDKVVAGGEAEVKAIMSEVLQNGVSMPYANTALGSSSKIMSYNGEIIQVVTNQVGGKTVVSNAWVVTDPAYKWQALKILSDVK